MVYYYINELINALNNTLNLIKKDIFNFAWNNFIGLAICTLLHRNTCTAHTHAHTDS